VKGLFWENVFVYLEGARGGGRISWDGQSQGALC